MKTATQHGAAKICIRCEKVFLAKVPYYSERCPKCRKENIERRKQNAAERKKNSEDSAQLRKWSKAGWPDCLSFSDVGAE